ncbi:vWA domain-containing protein [Timonella sp. A28]|uniref:vWA domain-containing protein n=1 Tax=Timonella sp. A28 TaxID=3442640 RepID=UPI003EB75674
MSFVPLFPGLVWAVLSVVIVGVVGFFAVQDARSRSWSRKSVVVWVRRVAVSLLVVFIGFGPSIYEESAEFARTNVDVYLVVDRTGSMAAEDYGKKNKPRLDGVRKDLHDTIDQLSGSRFSVISFDSKATRQIPLTTDTSALHSWVDGLNQETTLNSSGSSLNRVYETLATELKRSHSNNPQNKRIVYLFTDGENTSEEKRQSFAELKKYVDGGAVLGYGTEDGGKMKRYDPSNNSIEYIEDFTLSPAGPAISKIDLAELTAVANDIGVQLLHRNDSSSMDKAIAGVDPQLVMAQGYRVVEVQQLFIWPFAVLLGLLLMWELVDSTSRMTRKVG